MKYTSTRSFTEIDSLGAIHQGLAPDGGLYVPYDIPTVDISKCTDLAAAERIALGAFFDDIDEKVREDAIANLLRNFPKDDPIPMREVDGLNILELFHGPTGAFKDVALSVLPVLMSAAAKGKKVLILTATSGDTGSAAMAGFANVPGVEIVVFYPNVGTSKTQRLQMTTPDAKNVHAVAIRGNFDDAQTAVKRIFADEQMRADAEKAGVSLSSANSINIGRLVPQVGYYLLAANRLMKKGLDEFNVVVPSGNFGNILAAYLARVMGAPISWFYCASNINCVLTDFLRTSTYNIRREFHVTNSPSMDIVKSSNVERLVWLLSGGERPGATYMKHSDARRRHACEETAMLMQWLAKDGEYPLGCFAHDRIHEMFQGDKVTPEATEAEMRRVYEKCGYIVDPHTAVATAVAKKWASNDGKCLVAATATPYKFPETCMKAFGRDVLTNPPPAFADLEKRPITQTEVVDVQDIDKVVRKYL